MVKNLPASAGATGDLGLIPGWGRSPGGGHGSPLQHSCLENPTDRGAWQATVHGITKSWTRLSTHSINQKGPAEERECLRERGWQEAACRDREYKTLDSNCDSDHTPLWCVDTLASVTLAHVM